MTAHDVPVAGSWAVIDVMTAPTTRMLRAFSYLLAHHDFTDQTVLPGEIRTSEIIQSSVDFEWSSVLVS